MIFIHDLDLWNESTVPKRSGLRLLLIVLKYVLLLVLDVSAEEVSRDGDLESTGTSFSNRVELETDNLELLDEEDADCFARIGINFLSPFLNNTIWS